MDIFVKARKGTLAHYVYHKLAKENEPCFLLEHQKWITYDRDNHNANRFMIGPDVMMEKAAVYGRMIYQSDLFYSTEIYLFEVLRVYYFSTSLPKRVKQFLDEWYANRTY